MEGTCAARLVLPFARFASTRESLRDLAPPEVLDMNPDARLPLRATHEALESGADRIGEPRLGLSMGDGLCFGSGGVFDYAVRSAPTVKDSIRVAQRFSALIAVPFGISIETRGRRSIIRLDDTVPWSRTLADFAVSAWYKTHAADELPRDAKLEVCFPFAAPADRSRYEHLFRDATLTFGAPFLGFAFDAACEDAPMPVADRHVHELVCTRAEALLAELATPRAVTRAVRDLVDRATRDGEVATVESVAKKLHLSARTLSRRLEGEETTFAAELDGSRRALALLLVDQPGRSFPDIAHRLGFSHTESFFRAFKRWTGRSPSAYRVRTS